MRERRRVVDHIGWIPSITCPAPCTARLCSREPGVYSSARGRSRASAQEQKRFLSRVPHLEQTARIKTSQDPTSPLLQARATRSQPELEWLGKSHARSLILARGMGQYQPVAAVIKTDPPTDQLPSALALVVGSHSCRVMVFGYVTYRTPQPHSHPGDDSSYKVRLVGG